MKSKEEKVSMATVIKQIRDDIEDGKLDNDVKEVQSQKPLLFVKASLSTQKSPLSE
jgi:hypothetical protein